MVSLLIIPTYSLVTQNNGKNEARSTYGVLDYKMPNDLGAVANAIRVHDLGIEEDKTETE